MTKSTFLILADNQSTNDGKLLLRTLHDNFYLKDASRFEPIQAKYIENFNVNDLSLDNLNLTILVCINEASDCNAISNAITNTIESSKLPVLNIIPVYKDQSAQESKPLVLKSLASHYTRESIVWNGDNENLISMLEEASFCLSIHHKLEKGRKLCDDHSIGQLEQSRIDEDIKNNRIWRTASMLLSYIQNKEFKSNLRKLEGKELRYPTDSSELCDILYCFLNLSTIGNVVYSLLHTLLLFSVVGTYYAYERFSDNYHKHDNIFKFFATNDRDKAQALFYEAECDLTTFIAQTTVRNLI